MRARATIESQGSLLPFAGFGLDISCCHNLRKKKKSKKKFRKKILW